MQGWDKSMSETREELLADRLERCEAIQIIYDTHKEYVQQDEFKVLIAALRASALPMTETKELLAKAQDFIDCRYAARSDERQKAMGLAYIEAERQDLAREIVSFTQIAIHASHEKVRKPGALERSDSIVDRLRFDAARCEIQFSKGVAANVNEAADEIERLRSVQSTTGTSGLLARVAAAWNITLTEPSESWDMQPPINERYTEYVLTDAERAELRVALRAQPRTEEVRPVAWRWRPRGAANWIYDPSPEWRLEHQDSIETQPLYAAQPTEAPAGDVQALLETMQMTLNRLELAIEEGVCIHCINLATSYLRAALRAQPRTEEVREALNLAVNMIMAGEPGDSRAVSDEAVALAAVACGDTSEAVMKVIRGSTAAQLTESCDTPGCQYPSCTYGKEAQPTEAPAGDVREAITKYARDLRRNSSGGDDYPWDLTRGVADALDEILNYEGGAESPLHDQYVIDRAKLALSALDAVAPERGEK
jgi:hypothetical protein